MNTSKYINFPAEWYPQSAVQLTWPHEDTDWMPILEEVIPCFVAIAKEIIKREYLIIVCCNRQQVEKQLGDFDREKVIFCEFRSNDTWARDHGPISVFIDNKPVLYDFTFNGWGLKYPANYDNCITRNIFENITFHPDVTYYNCLDTVLEGGSIESNGEGILLTTYTCLGAPNRNETLNKIELDSLLKEKFGVKQILWLHNGYLAGDDTDSHVDTLARFCDSQTIAYVSCNDPEDEHYEQLKRMEQELLAFRTLEGFPFRLIALPMARKEEWNGERLPATYANFLIINGAVLVPVYDSPLDEEACRLLKSAFPDREIIRINCLPLIKQHGSLHCVTMQYPKEFF